MRVIAVLIAGWMLTGTLAANERPFSLGDEPPSSNSEWSLLPSGEESGRRLDEEVAREPRFESNEGVVKRSPSLPDPLPRSGSEGTNPIQTDISELPPRRTQWLMFTAEWCPACRAARADFEPWLARSGWRIDDSPQAHIRLIDGDAHPDLLAEMQIEMYPTFVLIHDGVESFRQQGYPGRAELVRRFVEAAESALLPQAAITVGTITGQRNNISTVIEMVRPLLGDGGTLMMHLDRDGESSVELPLGDRLSIRAGNPLVVRYSLEDDVLTCRFAEPLPQGHFSWGLPIEQPLSAVSASVSEVVLELPGAPDLKWQVAP